MALRLNKWKWIFYHEADHQAGQFELFNLDADIGETKNLASLYPEKVKEFSKLMTKSLKNYDAQMPVVKATGEIVKMP